MGGRVMYPLPPGRSKIVFPQTADKPRKCRYFDGWNMLANVEVSHHHQTTTFNEVAGD